MRPCPRVQHIREVANRANVSVAVVLDVVQQWEQLAFRAIRDGESWRFEGVGILWRRTLGPRFFRDPNSGLRYRTGPRYWPRFLPAEYFRQHPNFKAQTTTLHYPYPWS